MTQVFKQLFGFLGLGGVSAMPYLRLLKLAVIAAVVFVACLGIYHVLGIYTDSKANAVTVTHQKVEIKRKDAVIADQTKQAENRDVGKKVEDVIILKLDTALKKADRKTEQVITDLTQKTEEIQAAADKTPEQKAMEVAKVQIDTLWQNFCDSGGESTSCQATAANG